MLFVHNVVLVVMSPVSSTNSSVVDKSVAARIGTGDEGNATMADLLHQSR